DPGSGHKIALKFIRFALNELKLKGKSKTLTSILKYLSLDSTEELIEWSLSADISRMSSIVNFILDENIDDCSLLGIVEKSVARYLKDLLLLITKLEEDAKASSSLLSVALIGTLFESRVYRDIFISKLSNYISNAKFCFIKRDSCGTLEYVVDQDGIKDKNILNISRDLEAKIIPISTRLAVTESRNNKSTHLDTMQLEEIVDLMLTEENGIHKKITLFKQQLVLLIENVCEALNNGGRLLYIGAGTSGRLCVLDASECKHTFNVSSEKIQGVIAGGVHALYNPAEDAEDCILEGIAAMRVRSVNKNDVVIGVTACGKTPFVWGSLYEAKKRRAFTCLLAFNPFLEMQVYPDLVININLGPEVLTGSTRLKCGSATKIILNMISTIAMVRNGKCVGNLMSDVIAVNDKLKERAVRILQNLYTDRNKCISFEEAKFFLEQNNYNIKLTFGKLMMKFQQ
ncbi:N-acetylmuramic acid 6-phosphate etherase-like protein, partial [Leptotrombidium deliense]